MSTDGSVAFFWRVADTGDRILDKLTGSDQPPQTKRGYLKLVGEIYEKLREIHGHVADVAGGIAEAKNKREATQILGRLDQSGLEQELRARRLCDELERLGHALRPAIDEIPGLSGTQKAVWVMLAEELQSREAQTAWLYFDRLSDLRVLTASDEDLPSIQRSVRQIRDELLKQKAEFDQLARRAGELAQQVR